MMVVLNTTCQIGGLYVRKKNLGAGLGIPNIGDPNIPLIASWIWRYSAGDCKLWKQVVDLKYDSINLTSSLAQITRYPLSGKEYFGLVK